MTAIELRDTSPSDTAILTSLHAASFGEAAWNLKQMQGSLELKTTHGLVASQGDALLGFILYQMMPGETEILTFAVHPDVQRQKIGEQLLRKAIETIQSLHGSRIFLEVAADNEAASHLYEKFGFRKSGIRPNYYKRGAVTIDALLYERILSEQ